MWFSTTLTVLCLLLTVSNGNKAALSDLKTDEARYVAHELIKYAQPTYEEVYAAMHTPNRTAFNSWIGDGDSVELELPDDDLELYALFGDFQLASAKQKTTKVDPRIWHFLGQVDSESSEGQTSEERYQPHSVSDVSILELIKKKIYAIMPNIANSHSLDNGNSEKEAEALKKYETVKRMRLSRLYNMNGLRSDYSQAYSQMQSTGSGGQFWLASKKCIQHKQCQVYDSVRYLTKSKPYGCEDIHEHILPQLIDCVLEKGSKHCEMILDHGYFRIVFKVKLPNGDYGVLKMMKPRSITNDRDLLRHIREGILLSTVSKMEAKVLKAMEDAKIEEATDAHKFREKTFDETGDYGDIPAYATPFTSYGKKRAFYIVPELGHCLYPSFMSLSPIYEQNLDAFVSEGHTRNGSLQRATEWSVQIAKGLELLHSIPGGPFHHTDIQPRQFMVDDNDNILINDFNRGKFEMKYFGAENADAVEDERGLNLGCFYCGHNSRGHWRAPEELLNQPLNERLDVFSTALVVWSLFSYSMPFPELGSDALDKMYRDEWRRPRMPSNMPWAMKAVIRRALSHDSRDRPTATQLRLDLEYIRDNIAKLSGGKHKWTLSQLREQRSFADTNTPKPPSDGK